MNNLKEKCQRKGHAFAKEMHVTESLHRGLDKRTGVLGRNKRSAESSRQEGKGELS